MGIYANIGGILMVNVTKYSIHGSYGLEIISYKIWGVFATIRWLSGDPLLALRRKRRNLREKDSCRGRWCGYRRCWMKGMKKAGYPLVICYIAIENGDL